MPKLAICKSYAGITTRLITPVLYFNTLA